jgi:hypothetical protein
MARMTGMAPMRGMTGVGRCVFQQSNDVGIVECVDREAAVASRSHEASGAQQTQLMRGGRFAHAHGAGQIGHAAIAVHELVEDGEPRGVAEELEERRHLPHIHRGAGPRMNFL